MNKPSSSSPWWSSFGFGKREAPPDTDYADMGTAFGLDASMPSLPAEDEPQAAPDAKAQKPGATRKPTR
ncbi:MAG: hypothetical protein KF788_00400 [Piscinibacter sp.]|nr:hypothetical protein [Piscinibacter sp.]